MLLVIILVFILYGFVALFKKFDVFYYIFSVGARQWLRLPTFGVPSCKLPSETLGTGMHLQFVLHI